MNSGHVRWCVRRDLPEVLAIDAGSFEEPWDEEEFLRQLRQRNYISMVVERGERVVGFMVYELFVEKLELIRLAVDPTYRRRGFGRRLVEKLLNKLSSRRRDSLFINTPDHLLDTHLFLRQMGFHATPLTENEYRFAHGIPCEDEFADNLSECVERTGTDYE